MYWTIAPRLSQHAGIEEGIEALQEFILTWTLRCTRGRKSDNINAEVWKGEFRPRQTYYGDPTLLKVVFAHRGNDGNLHRIHGTAHNQRAVQNTKFELS